MLLRNIAPAQGLCNGTRATVIQMSSCVIEVRLMGGDRDGKTAFIPQITLCPSQNNLTFAFKLKRRQLPVQLAYAMSINKAQGQTVNKIGLYLLSPVFSHGQLYVAFSQATKLENIFVYLPKENKTKLNGSFTTTNIVYPEILL
jgi:ATP-dependent DNA helicase PIF1